MLQFAGFQQTCTTLRDTFYLIALYICTLQQLSAFRQADVVKIKLSTKTGKKVDLSDFCLSLLGLL